MTLGCVVADVTGEQRFSNIPKLELLHLTLSGGCPSIKLTSDSVTILFVVIPLSALRDNQVGKLHPGCFAFPGLKVLALFNWPKVTMTKTHADLFPRLQCLSVINCFDVKIEYDALLIWTLQEFTIFFRLRIPKNCVQETQLKHRV